MDGQRLEHAAGLLRTLGHGGALDGASEGLAGRDVADDVVPLREVRCAFGVEEGFGCLADAHRAEVVAAHGGRVALFAPGGMFL